MEHICFEVQLCSEILIFNENSNFGYTDHPEKSALILQSEYYSHGLTRSQYDPYKKTMDGQDGWANRTDGTDGQDHILKSSKKLSEHKSLQTVK